MLAIILNIYKKNHNDYVRIQSKLSACCHALRKNNLGVKKERNQDGLSVHSICNVCVRKRAVDLSECFHS